MKNTQNNGEAKRGESFRRNGCTHVLVGNRQKVRRKERERELAVSIHDLRRAHSLSDTHPEKRRGKEKKGPTDRHWKEGNPKKECYGKERRTHTRARAYAGKKGHTRKLKRKISQREVVRETRSREESDERRIHGVRKKKKREPTVHEVC